MTQNDPDLRDRIAEPAPTDWIDGHPQLEAMARAVYEQCETGDTGIVHDDPRNIAVAALAAVLPAPDQRAAVLLWAADQIDAETRQLKADGVLEPDKYRPCRDAADQLRRLAGKAQQDEATPQWVCKCPAGLCGCGHHSEAQQDPAPGGEFVPPVALGLPAGTLEAAEIGANQLDAWARTPNGRNFLAHALVQLARTGWLRTEPGESFEPVRNSGDIPEPLDPTAPARSGQPERDGAARTVKLVRDRIPMIAAGHGQRLNTRTAEPGELPALLRAKVMEEEHEVDAASPKELLGELADLLEAIQALTLAAGHTLDDLEEARALKAMVRGGFTLGFVLETDGEARPKQVRGPRCVCGGRFPISHLHADEHRSVAESPST
ncbi:nucleoside triphosphate pyrophosphohydrolase [Streptomyces griseofuscus]|uniref:Uncharacterized protein n=1 Tax=Streptomyces griseofuscus TaxID=146922 RepID=A0A426RZ03_9ACTN|nr:nucleoside triphosphate pyrophosphohydrolase [Streptomyces griseofuscus]RRQ81521.1 hypothetical protein CQW44_30435 [Streptomyces griseofuscus]